MKHWNVAAYIRLSKEDGDNIESNSITNQKDIIKQFVDNCPDMTVAEFYIDDGYSGTNFDRPAIKKLMEDIVDEKVNAVIVKDLSRLGRNHIYVDFLLEEIFPKHKIRFISISDKFDSNENEDVMDDYTVPVRSLMNDIYSHQISKKTKSVLRAKKESGEYLSPSAPYGYLKDPEDKHKLIKDIEASNNVKMIFEMSLKGKLPSEIAFSLNEMDIFIPSEYKKRDKINENLEHKKWNNDRVTEILKNRVYIGEITQGKKKSESYRSHRLVNVDKENWIITKNHHEPLVSEEDFNKVQELLKRQGTKVDENGNVDLFYGYLICNECGSAMRKSQKYYYCNTYSRTRKCSKHSTNRAKLYDYVIKDINNKVEKYKNLIELNRDIMFEIIDSIKICEDGRIIVKYKK